MAVLGTLVGIGLYLLSVPIALTLGIMTGVLSFIPILGGILAAIPSILVALTQGNDVLLKVVLLYVGAQVLESNLLTPLVQQRAVSLPPVLALMSQLLLGALAGALGLALAVPLAVVLLTALRQSGVGADMESGQTGEK
jgi:predicted PurR-regulated permease PerM